MSWSKCCYLYHKEMGGIFLGDAREGQLILDHVGKPLTVDQYLPEGRYGVSRIQSCIMLDLDEELEMSVSPKKRLGGLFATLEEGFFDHELGRRGRDRSRCSCRGRPAERHAGRDRPGSCGRRPHCWCSPGGPARDRRSPPPGWRTGRPDASLGKRTSPVPRPGPA